MVPTLVYDSIGASIVTRTPVDMLTKRDQINLFIHLSEQLGAFKDINNDALEAIFLAINKHW